jgi:hypothetical protein
MKKLITAILALVALNAFAADVFIFEMRAPMFGPATPTSQEFKLNRDLERAWVELSVTEVTEAAPDIYRVKVPGLFFDAASSAIVLTHEGQNIECAKVKHRKFFNDDVIKPTGRCELDSRLVTKKIDNGFEIVTVTILQFFIGLK